MSVGKGISVEERELLTQKLREAGCAPDQKIKISDFRRANVRLYQDLLNAARSAGLHDHVTRLLTELGFDTHHKPDILQELKKVLREVYTPQRIREAMQGGERLLNIGELRQEQPVVSRYLTRRYMYNNKGRGVALPPMIEVVNSLYSDWPPLMFLISNQVRLEYLSPEQVGEELRSQYFRREDISWIGLRENNNILYRWLYLYTKDQQKNKFEEVRDKDITNVIEELSRIHRKNFSIRGSRNIKRMGSMSEAFVKLLLWGTYLTDVCGANQTSAFRRCFPHPITGVYPIPTRVNNSKGAHLTPIPLEEEKDPDMLVDILTHDALKDSQKLFADAVIVSPRTVCIVEAKNWRFAVKGRLDELKERFDPKRELLWRRGGRRVSKRTLVVHSTRDVCKTIEEHLRDEPVSIMTPFQFGKSLEIALKALEEKGYTRENVYSVDDLLSLYQQVAESPYILIRKSHEQQFTFLDYELRNLLSMYARGEKPEKQHALRVDGKTGSLKRNGSGTFLHFRMSLDDLPGSKIKTYLQRRIERIPEGTVFYDLETVGSLRKFLTDEEKKAKGEEPGKPEKMARSQIYLPGIMYRQGGGVRFELPFARNPWEEEAVLRYFCDRLRGFDEMVSFNGLTFDAPMLRERLLAHMMQEELLEKHTDVYNVLVRAGLRKEARSLKLQHIGRLFGESATGAPSKEGPRLYIEWLLTGDPDKITGDPRHDLFEHNCLDLMKTAAVYITPNLWERFLKE